MLDPLIADLLACIEDTHAATDYERDPIRFCELQNIEYRLGPSNLARVGRYGGPDIICVQSAQFGSRDLFTVSHEIAHIIAKREGYIRLIRHHHLVRDMKRHIELLMNEAGARLLMPAPDLYSAAMTFGDKPGAIRHIAELSGASQMAAMRRWVRQDFGEARGAFEIQRGYIYDLVSYRARLPFRKWARVPEVALEHPELMLLSLGGGRVLGTVTE